MDADLGWVTFRTLSRLDPRKSKHIWFNEGTPGADKTMQVYHSQPHLVAELKQSLAQGKRCFVTSNAKGKVVQLARAMKDDFPAKAFVTITADTAQEKAIKDFISDPSTEALKYDAVFACPSIGTGVDIAFPDQAQAFDAVFGFCEAQITTHLEFDQQLSRVRHPGEVKVWITPRKFNFETEFQVVKRDALERSLFKNLVVDYDDSGEPQYQENDPFLEMASLIVSEQRASKNDLKGNFVRHKEKQGFLIKYVGKDHKAFGEGQALLMKGKSLDDETYCEAISSAKPLTPPEYDRLGEAVRAGEPLSDSEKWSYERATIEDFYQESVTAELINLDQRGRFRAKVRLFEAVFEGPDVARFDLPLAGRRLVTGKAGKVAAIRMLLRLTPLLTSDGRLGAVVEACDLAQFTDTVSRKKAAIENQLGVQVQRDFRDKPVQQLGRILGLVGLRLERVHSRKEKEKKVYGYRLAPGPLARMKAIVQARKGPMPVFPGAGIPTKVFADE
jgi:hypothetical protein